jgi:hypothetical protein
MEVRSMKGDEVMNSLRSKSRMCSKRRCGSKLDVERTVSTVNIYKPHIDICLFLYELTS